MCSYSWQFYFDQKTSWKDLLTNRGSTWNPECYQWRNETNIGFEKEWPASTEIYTVFFRFSGLTVVPYVSSGEPKQRTGSGSLKFGFRFKWLFWTLSRDSKNNKFRYSEKNRATKGSHKLRNPAGAEGKTVHRRARFGPASRRKGSVKKCLSQWQ